MKFNVVSLAVALFVSSAAANWNGTIPLQMGKNGTVIANPKNGTAHGTGKIHHSGPTSTKISPPITAATSTGSAAAASSSGAAAVNQVAGSAFGLVIAGGVALVI
ncbi:uncharacterized protein K452DRAFT_287785 [Aplosporella prunicola CBS 121167]|uniref:Uncharacterized protein n=1 Tax=Aplosporella prunicola CBS 121167 TaxID=1176127 RepID=A0A6A6BF02_9PEZI|nr:uncharacterized protein K452DRAFT_287785 [Aplosporella prunicola CBS 121167]KAF2141824.1 hypothetical protein K452DRAFT_287785 [Aplosporella prunicola CBS 121167]